jgi:hypothetical protein
MMQELDALLPFRPALERLFSHYAKQAILNRQSLLFGDRLEPDHLDLHRLMLLLREAGLRAKHQQVMAAFNRCSA